VRPSIVANIQDGMHEIIPVEGQQPNFSTAEGILLAHVALSSFSRFQEKIQNIREVFDHHDGKLDPGFGWHWKRWLGLDQKGNLQEEFRWSVFSQPVIEKLRDERVIRNAQKMLGKLFAASPQAKGQAPKCLG